MAHPRPYADADAAYDTRGLPALPAVLGAPERQAAARAAAPPLHGHVGVAGTEAAAAALSAPPPQEEEEEANEAETAASGAGGASGDGVGGARRSAACLADTAVHSQCLAGHSQCLAAEAEAEGAAIEEVAVGLRPLADAPRGVPRGSGAFGEESHASHSRWARISSARDCRRRSRSSSLSASLMATAASRAFIESVSERMLPPPPSPLHVASSLPYLGS